MIPALLFLAAQVVAVSPDLDLAVTLPAQGRPNLSLVLRDRAKANLRYQLADVPGPPDCTLRLERATATDTVLSCIGEKTDIHPNWKFLYDIRAKALVSRLSYMPFAFHGASVAMNGERAIRVQLQPQAEPAFRIEASALDGQRPFPPLFAHPAGLPPLPQSTYDDFFHARMARVSNGYVRGATTLEEIIGPRVQSGNLLWFGKSFYDGEGHSGIGAFGFFDPATRSYTLFSPPELAPYSVSAIAVSAESVWLGLVHNGEWGSSGAGLLRFNRATQIAHHFASPDIPATIRLERARVVATTNFGITIVDGERQRRYFVDQTSSGGLRVVEAIR